MNCQSDGIILGTGDNAAGFLEPNFGSVLDFAVPGREQVSLGRLYYTFKPIEDLSVTIGPQMVAPDFVDIAIATSVRTY